MKKIVSFALLLALVLSCSSGKETLVKKDDSVKPKKEISKPKPTVALIEGYEVTDVTSWINLMPGSTEPRFHITGRVVTTNEGNKIANTIKLKNIVIKQHGNEVIEVSPGTKYNEGNNGEEIVFSTFAGSRLGPLFKANEPFNAEIHFEKDGKTVVYIIENIKAEKVY